MRLVHKFDDAAEIIITSHDESVSIPGAVRYEPKNNVLEIDRFTAELIGDDMCFLYGDVLYSESAVKSVISHRGESRCCFRQQKSICAVLVGDGELFRSLYLEVRRRFLDGEIKSARAGRCIFCTPDIRSPCGARAKAMSCSTHSRAISTRLRITSTLCPKKLM